MDRIIISYQKRTRVVETVYVTEHDRAAFGKFSPDRTYEISSELIQTLQNPQLDLTNFLTKTGYYGHIQVVQGIEDYQEPSAQQMFNIVQTYSGSARTELNNDLQFFSEALNQRLNINIVPFSDGLQVHSIVNISPHNSGPVANYSEVQHKYRRPKVNKRQRALRQSYWVSGWKQPYKGKGADIFAHVCLTVLCISTVGIV